MGSLEKGGKTLPISSGGGAGGDSGCIIMVALVRLGLKRFCFERFQSGFIPNRFRSKPVWVETGLCETGLDQNWFCPQTGLMCETG